MSLTLPELSLVALVGVSGSGKSTFARKHFKPTEVLSSDFFRGLVSDDENDQSATEAAFDALYYVAGKRLAAGRLTVVDATNVQQHARKTLVSLARSHHVLTVAVVLDVPESVCVQRNAARPDRAFGAHVIRNQRAQLRRAFGSLRKEGFNYVYVLRGVEEVEAAQFDRVPLLVDRRNERGPFDIIGDVHGCHAELVELLAKLGYQVSPDGSDAVPPPGRRAVFVGDLVDRGPATPAVLRLVMNMAASGGALCVPGNHEAKLLRALRGANVRVSHGLAESLAQLAAEPPEFATQVEQFIDGLVSHMVLDDGALVVAHAGLREDMQGRASGAVRAFALYGDTTGETDEFGLPVRYPWAEDYRGKAAVVYGHTPVPEGKWVNRTICVDTGCVFGGRLTALRWPERELVDVPAARVYYEPARPLVAEPVVEERHRSELDLDDVLGRRHVETRLLGRVTIAEENGVAALEVMSRFAVDPRWLVYLPPTMAPTATTSVEGLLEHPAEAFAALRADGVQRVVCEEKHMGSRAVVVVCRSEEVGRERFDVAGDGVVVTRTGRPFFTDAAMADGVLSRVRAAVDAAGLWDELATDWLVLDAELLPWSLKAEGLLRRQYGSVGAAARADLTAAEAVLAAVEARGVPTDGMAGRTAERLAMAHAFTDSYRRFCWPVRSIEDIRLAPFQVLAGEGAVHALKPHDWHLSVLGRLADVDPALFRRTEARLVDVADDDATAGATAWWEAMTEAGGEGMVVKPVDVVVRGPKGVAQPGIKCRGREYLRIIYGPEYTAPEHLARLRSRGLGRKRGLAIREFALGIEALERFVAREPLYRVHECVFGVLALESEPVDPRL